MKHKVISCKRFAGAADIYELVCTRDNMQFEPGNCIDITNPKTGLKKPYSIASSPSDDHLRFYIRTWKLSNGISKYITTLDAGDEVEIGEPFGYFTPGKNELDGKYIYIATGTGMAPFKSALTHYKHLPAMILYGVKTYSNILPIPAHALGRYNIAVSRESNGLPTHIQGYFSKLPVDKPTEYSYYICGLEAMISDVTQFLIGNGVLWSLIHTEQFYY